MSSEINTILVSDPRISRISSDIHVAVKEGPASCVVQGYKTNSNSNSTTLFNVNVPSENTLVDRNLRINGTIHLTLEIKTDGEIAQDTFTVVPAAFPLNQALQSASLTLNNSKVSVQSADILNVITKQYEQRFLSKHIQTTPSYVDKYFGVATDAMNGVHTSGWGCGIENAEKDSDTTGRGDSDLTLAFYTADGTLVPAGQQLTAGTTFYVQLELNVSEPILGMPTLEFKEDEASFMGINSLELVLQYNDFKNVFNCKLDIVQSVIAGSKYGAATDLFLTDDTKLMTRQMSLHPSQYAKLNTKNVLPFDEFIAYKSSIDLPADGQAISQVSTQVISMRQVPDKIYVLIRPQYRAQKQIWSNNLMFPITSVNIVFNNKAGLLSEMTQKELYQMSRRNGSQQSWNEFRGKVRDGNRNLFTSLGSIVVIDPVRDLGLDDILSSGSLGQFGFQAMVSADEIYNISNSEVGSMELVVIASYGGTMITQQGSSMTMSGLLTKSSVLEAKENSKSAIDFEALSELSGGNFAKKGITAVGDLLKKHRVGIGSAVGSAIKGSGSYNQTGGSKLSKYM